MKSTALQKNTSDAPAETIDFSAVIIEQIKITDKKRQDYMIQSLLLGFKLLYTQSQMDYGQWGKFVKKLTSSDDISVDDRSIRDYMYLARNLNDRITKFSQGKSIPADSVAATIQTLEDKEIELLCEMAAKPDYSGWLTRAKVSFFREQLLEKFVSGRSLRQMINDFRTAQIDTDEEIKKETDPLANAKDVTPGKREEEYKNNREAQTDFFNELDNSLAAWKQRLRTPQFTMLPKEDKKAIAEALRAEAEAIEATIK